MRCCVRLLRGLTLLVLGGVLIPASASAQTYNRSFSIGANLGTLTYTATSTPETCDSDYGVIGYTEWTYYNFTYTSPQNGSQPISGETWYDLGIGGRLVGSGSCPSDPRGDPVVYNGSGGYTITISILTGSPGYVSAKMSVPGYINPKYAVLGVTYAPPGPQSFVNYSNGTLVSNTSSISSSMASGYTLSISITASAGILGWADGSTTSTASTSYSQESTNSSSVTVSKTTDISLQVPGPASPYVGVDHDYDVIWVWLNPVALFTLNNSGVVQWNGYGYSTLDQPAMDVIGVFVGCLNGDLSQSSCNSLYQTAFARNWASVESWPSGQGPGLTTTDLQSILATDPYGKCTSTSAIGSSVCPSPDPTRFTLTLNQNIQYQQPPPGGQPFTVSYTESYTNTTTQGQEATYVFSQTFAYEKTFSGKLFGNGFSITIGDSQSLTWTNEWNKQFTNSTTSTAQASITGPTCNVVGNACSPVYPPSSPAYGEAIGFDVYQDNLYGTFLLIPVSY